MTKTTSCRIFSAILVATILAMSYALGTAHKKQGMLEAGIQYMLAQRVAVLEVENFIVGRQPWRNTAEIRGYAELIVDAATEFRKDPMIVARVALAESGLNPGATGDGGRAIGIMQIHARWWVNTVPFVKSAKDLRDPRTNIRAGAWILRHYADLCGEEQAAYLACFNGGPKPNEQARAYAARVVGGA